MPVCGKLYLAVLHTCMWHAVHGTFDIEVAR
jgi:hypothetical protein